MAKLSNTLDKLRRFNAIATLARLLPAVAAAPLALGVLAALLIVGLDGVDPSNIGWASEGDSATHYLGWRFFRNSPWTLPLGANPSYGLEIGSSIFYSDSIPLLALLFKPISAWLPETFQYLGLWTALCCVLQACFAWQLLGYMPEIRSRWLRWFGSGLFVFSPPLMLRISGHSALVAHWMILAGLCLYMSPTSSRRRRYAWPALVLVATLVHSYLFVMLLVLWAADSLRRSLAGQAQPSALLVDTGLVLGAAALGLWQVGFFMLQVEPSGGFGDHKMNLLALVNPDIYSHLLKPLAPPFSGFHEGFNFLGLGCLLLLPFSLPKVMASPALLRVDRRHWPLALALAMLTAFAVTNQLSVGSLSLTIPLPRAVLDAASVLRSSGRMFWPAYYVLVLALIVLSVRSHGERVACWLLALALLVQVADTSEGWRKHHTHFEHARAGVWQTPFQSHFWRVAGTLYRRLRSVPLVHHAPDYAVRADYAASHRMATDSAYLARVDPFTLEAAAFASEKAIVTANFDPDTLYLLDRAHAAEAAKHLDVDADLLTLVDGFYVLAPGWRDRVSNPDVAPRELRLADFITPSSDDTIFFGEGGTGSAYLGAGWSETEAWGVWTDGSRAMVSLPIAGSTLPPEVALEVGALIAPNHPTQEVDCLINGSLVARLHFDQTANTRWRSVPITEPAARSQKAGVLAFEFKLLNPASPKSLGLSDDLRELGMALHRIRVPLPP